MPIPCQKLKSEARGAELIRPAFAPRSNAPRRRYNNAVRNVVVGLVPIDQKPRVAYVRGPVCLNLLHLELTALNSLPLSPLADVRVPAPDAERAWTDQMKRAIRDSHDLLAAVGLSELLTGSVVATPGFPTFVPPALLARIRPGDPNDPILRQVLPLSLEDDPETQAGFTKDPLAEFPAGPELGDLADPAPAREQKWIQKYHGRALLITTGACGVHCRYCFRRHFPYPAAPQQRTRWQPWLEPIAADPSIREVILSGGDPLVLSDASLERLSLGLREITHVRWLRIHSRMPVVIPQRITPELLALFAGFAAKTMVIHANHARELDESVSVAISDLRNSGFQVLNQAVLLRGVNDSVGALADLSSRLIECGATPYYLHQLDRVRGAAHFEVPIARGLELVRELRNQLPGYAIPRYVQEIPGQPSKTVLA